MNNNKLILTLLAFALMVGSAKAQTSTSEVLLETTAGNIRIALFDETPQHRDNFLKNVQACLRFPAFPPCHQGFHDTKR